MQYEIDSEMHKPNLQSRKADQYPAQPSLETLSCSGQEQLQPDNVQTERP